MRRAAGAPHTGRMGRISTKSVSGSNSRTIGREVVWVRSLKLKNRMFGLAQAAAAENEPHRRRTCSSSRSCAKVAYMQALRGLSEVQPPPQRTVRGHTPTRRGPGHSGVLGDRANERSRFAQAAVAEAAPQPRRTSPISASYESFVPWSEALSGGTDFLRQRTVRA